MRSATTCKTCRRLGVSVCGREKCAIKRKPYPPGVHGRAFRRGGSEYGSQLAEKQKVKFTYGLRERQFRNYVEEASLQKAMPAGEALVSYLERRLDNVVYRLGFAKTRAAARQMVNHGHVCVNGRKVTIPSYRVKAGEEVRLREESLTKKIFADTDIILKKHESPVWIELDKNKKSGKVTLMPPKDFLEEAGRGFNTNAVVEFYSR